MTAPASTTSPLYDVAGLARVLLLALLLPEVLVPLTGSSALALLGIALPAFILGVLERARPAPRSRAGQAWSAALLALVAARLAVMGAGLLGPMLDRATAPTPAGVSGWLLPRPGNPTWIALGLLAFAGAMPRRLDRLVGPLLVIATLVLGVLLLRPLPAPADLTGWEQGQGGVAAIAPFALLLWPSSSRRPRSHAVGLWAAAGLLGAAGLVHVLVRPGPETGLSPLVHHLLLQAPGWIVRTQRRGLVTGASLVLAAALVREARSRLPADLRTGVIFTVAIAAACNWLDARVLLPWLAAAWVGSTVVDLGRQSGSARIRGLALGVLALPAAVAQPLLVVAALVGAATSWWAGPAASQTSA